MHILGLVGGIGSGKSFVAELFEQLGAGRIDADRIGHQILFLPEIKQAARLRWGDDVFDIDGELNRRKLAERVFAQTSRGKDDLAFLTERTHPLISLEMERRIEEFRRSEKEVVVLDAPLLLETRWRNLIEQIVFVDAPVSIRLERVLKRGWTEAEFAARESNQISPDAKKKQANWIIDNSENSDQTLDQIKKIWQNIGLKKIT